MYVPMNKHLIKFSELFQASVEGNVSEILSFQIPTRAIRHCVEGNIMSADCTLMGSGLYRLEQCF